MLLHFSVWNYIVTRLLVDLQRLNVRRGIIMSSRSQPKASEVCQQLVRVRDSIQFDQSQRWLLVCL